MPDPETVVGQNPEALSEGPGRTSDPEDLAKKSERSEKAHPAARRERIQMTKARFRHVAVRQGTEQSGAILTLTDEFGALAEVIETRCHDSREKSTALTLLLQAKMMAVHAITHRGGG